MNYTVVTPSSAFCSPFCGWFHGQPARAGTVLRKRIAMCPQDARGSPPAYLGIVLAQHCLGRHTAPLHNCATLRGRRRCAGTPPCAAPAIPVKEAPS